MTKAYVLPRPVWDLKWLCARYAPLGMLLGWRVGRVCVGALAQSRGAIDLLVPGPLAPRNIFVNERYVKVYAPWYAPYISILKMNKNRNNIYSMIVN